MDELTKKGEMEDKSFSGSGGILLLGQRMPMQLWEHPERENSWTSSDFLFQTYSFGLQRWESKVKAVLLLDQSI